MIRRPPRSTQSRSSAASDVYKRQEFDFVPLSEGTVTKGDIDFIVRKVGEFDRDNRGGIERTLHRISAIRNRHNDVVGLTCRVGRALYGKIEIIEDLVKKGS